MAISLPNFGSFGSIISGLTNIFTSVGAFHPTYQMTKTAPGVFKINWGTNLTGTNELTLTIKDDVFDITGQLRVIGPDSVFPFNVVAQMVNGAFQNMFPKSGKVPKKLALEHPVSDSTKDAIAKILHAKVGTVIEVTGTN